jgi:hypothetical protein
MHAHFPNLPDISGEPDILFLKYQGILKSNNVPPFHVLRACRILFTVLTSSGNEIKTLDPPLSIYSHYVAGAYTV